MFMNFSDLTIYSTSQILLAQQNEGMIQRKFSYTASWQITLCRIVVLCFAIEYGIFFDLTISIRCCSSVARINISRNQECKYYYSQSSTCRGFAFCFCILGLFQFKGFVSKEETLPAADTKMVPANYKQSEIQDNITLYGCNIMGNGAISHK